MHSVVLIIFHLHTKFELPSFTYFKDTIRAPKFTMVHLTQTTPLSGVVCHPFARTWCVQHSYQIWSLCPPVM